MDCDETHPDFGTSLFTGGWQSCRGEGSRETWTQEPPKPWIAKPSVAIVLRDLKRKDLNPEGEHLTFYSPSCSGFMSWAVAVARAGCTSALFMQRAAAMSAGEERGGRASLPINRQILYTFPMPSQGAGAARPAHRSRGGTGFVTDVSSHRMEPQQPQLGWGQADQAGQRGPGASPSP